MSGFYIGIDGKAQKAKPSCIGVNGVARRVKKIYLGDKNGVAREVYFFGKKLSEYTVGSTVYLRENGTPVEYLIVHKGLPNETLYDPSCDGVWLLRKDIYTRNQWDDYNNNYKQSTVHNFLNDTFLNLFNTATQKAIKQVKIPYHNEAGSVGSVDSGANGLDTKVFLLSAYEVGWTTNVNMHIPIDGACISYFSGLTSVHANRIAKFGGEAAIWWLRSPHKFNTNDIWNVATNGGYGSNGCVSTMGVRPALILPYNAMFDEETGIFGGVA